eukprot:TRINITY_DN465_c0_g1_i5.p3 TRINITY_DN465_c0_g1~~TRINITY_DN465_c0_g1_i5.p3  ORF type:complete len:100 (-),score=12.33 TRINITY_DN465_c0_g1_i5:412-711(-)
MGGWEVGESPREGSIRWGERRRQQLTRVKEGALVIEERTCSFYIMCDIVRRFVLSMLKSPAVISVTPGADVRTITATVFDRRRGGALLVVEGRSASGRV